MMRFSQDACEAVLGCFQAPYRVLGQNFGFGIVGWDLDEDLYCEVPTKECDNLGGEWKQILFFSTTRTEFDFKVSVGILKAVQDTSSLHLPSPIVPLK